MIDLEKRLKRVLSSMAGNEALAEMLDESAAADLLKWGEEMAGHIVSATSEADDDAADEMISPRLRALHTMMRAMGHWASAMDLDTRLEFWNRIEQNGKDLFGDAFRLPPMNDVLKQMPEDLRGEQALGWLKNLIERQKSKG